MRGLSAAGAAARRLVGAGEEGVSLAEPRLPAGEALIAARANSTLAVSAKTVVALAGRFDRGPGTGRSAAEALLAAWEQQAPGQGVEALARFEGAWAAAVLDRESGALHLLRDPFGIRRLFFAQKGGWIAFSTQIRPLLQLPGVSRDLAREHLAEYLSFRYVHAPRTLLRDIQALPAGHRLEVTPGAPGEALRVSMAPWFSLRYSTPWSRPPDDADALAELERRLNRSVAARASGKERVGVFLSGGLDSSAISAVAARLGPVHTWTVGIEDAEDDELPYASRVANLLRTHHEVVRINPASYRDAFDRIVAGADQPVTDPAAIPQLLLAEAAKQTVDVILSGDGGDEIFGGRMVGAIAAQLPLSRLLSRLPGPALALAARALGSRRPELHDPTLPVGLARRIGGLQIFDRDARSHLIRDPGWVRPGVRLACLEPFYREVASDPINEILHAWLRGRMAEDGLARSGLAASISGLSLREPLLDRDLVTFCAGLPGAWKVRRSKLDTGGAITKWPLRELLRPILGRSLVNRPKRVLPGPWKRWFEGPLQGFMQDRANDLREDRARLFLPGAVDALLRQMQQPGTDVKVWTLIFLDAWIRSVGAT